MPSAEYRNVWAVLDQESGDRYGGVYDTKAAALQELARQRLQHEDKHHLSLTLAHIKPNGTIIYHEDY